MDEAVVQELKSALKKQLKILGGRKDRDIRRARKGEELLTTDFWQDIYPI